MRVAGHLALALVATFYILSNLSYFVGASKEEIIRSRRLVVSLLMKNIWGESVERWVDLAVALSALGNVLAVVSLVYHFPVYHELTSIVIFPRKSEPRIRKTRCSAAWFILGFE